MQLLFFSSFRLMRGEAILVVLLALGCDGNASSDKPSASGSAKANGSAKTSPASPTGSAASEGAVKVAAIAGKAKLKVGDPIGICWRESGDNPAKKNPADFDCAAQVKALDAPGSADIHGKAIMAAVTKALGGKKIKEVKAKSVDVGGDPKALTAGAYLKPDVGENEYFGNYVRTDANGKHWMFLEVTLAK